MCGIAGIFDPRGVESEQVSTMCEALVHRGPDGSGLYVDECVGIGFRRLAIIDLETGDQPIASEDTSIRVVCNGEIYNYRELREALERRGHRFSTTSDTEVLVHLYEERGEALVDDLRGMFAFAIWDARRRRLLLARDRFGQKPLYWAVAGSRLYFASEIKAILAARPSFRRMDPRGLDQYLSLRILIDPRSMFEGIRKLPPAHLLTIADDGGGGTPEPAVRRYWRLEYEPKLALGDDEALEQLSARVQETVGLHMVSDVPVGAFLSGGIDSGLVTAAMARAADTPFRTFSVSVPYREYDEAPAARAVAERLGTIHRESEIGAGLVRRLPEVVYHADEPADPLALAMYHLAEFAAPEVKVALGGDGGDELFGGYDRYYGARYARWYAALPAALRRNVIRRLIDLAPDGFWYKSLSHKLRWLDELATVEGGRRYARALGYFYFTPEWRSRLYTGDFRTHLGQHDPEAAIVEWHDREDLREPLDRMLMADLGVRLPNHSVMILDRMSMAHGLEARSPFLDHELAQFAARLGAHLKVRGRRRRWLQMRLAERELPDEVLSRPKQGFSSALPYLVRSSLQRLYAHFLPGAHLVEAGLLRRPVIEDMLSAHRSGRTDHGNRLWLLLNAELWHRIHIEETSIERLSAEVADALPEGGERPTTTSHPSRRLAGVAAN